MGKLSEKFQANYDAITSTTKGAASATHVLWSSVLLTFFQAIVELAESAQAKSEDAP